MNRSKFNLEEILKDYSEAQNLGDLFHKVEDTFAARGEVVCQFIINGMALTEADEQRMSQVPFDEIRTLEIDSESPAVLLFGLLNNWIAELPELLRSIDSLAKDIKFKGIEGKLKSFVDMIDSCQFLVESLINLESILKKESMDIENWKKNKVLTARAIGDALGAFENKDFVLLSEVLEYDLGHSLQEWLEEIIRMRDHLKQENDKDSKQFSARIFEKQQSETSDQANPIIGSSEHTS